MARRTKGGQCRPATDPEALGRVGRPTLRDVAAVAGVSFKTVSRVVNGEPGVRPATAERVLGAVRQLGFQPNEIASSLKRGVSRDTIGLVIEDVANPFFARLLRAVEEVTRERGLLVITASSDEDPARERQVIDSLVKRRVNGLLVVPAGRDHRYLSRELRMGMAIVFVDRPPWRLRADAVLVDNRAGARSAVEHLIAHGHRRIAAIGDRLEVYTMEERHAGYREALEASGIALDPAIVRFDCHDTTDAERAVESLLALPEPPTAIFGTNNRMAVGAVQALVQRRSSAALVGFDDFELAGSLSTPVTVVTGDNDLLGRTAAELLLRRMGGWAGPVERITLPTRLIVRGSGEIPPDGPKRGRGRR
jgi:LacI family transcriptional regulator